MDPERARQLLQAERDRLQGLLADKDAAAAQDRDSEDEADAWDDPAQPLIDEAGDDALIANFRDRLAAVDRAEARLDAGTYGVSVRSGKPIPDERLEADPTAELTVEEAAGG